MKGVRKWKKLHNNTVKFSHLKDHIERNRHHYENPVDYLSFASENFEMEMIIKFLKQMVNYIYMRQGCKIVKLGNATAIMCGGEPTDHECNEDLSLLFLENGDRVENTPENYEKHFENVRGGSVACSICGRAAIDNSMWL